MKFFKLDSTGDTRLEVHSLDQAAALLKQFRSAGASVFRKDTGARADSPAQLGEENVVVPRIVGG